MHPTALVRRIGSVPESDPAGAVGFPVTHTVTTFEAVWLVARRHGVCGAPSWWEHLDRTNLRAAPFWQGRLGTVTFWAAPSWLEHKDKDESLACPIFGESSVRSLNRYLPGASPLVKLSLQPAAAWRKHLDRLAPSWQKHLDNATPSACTTLARAFG